MKLGGLSALGGLAFSGDFPPGQWSYQPGTMARVAYDSISVFDAPDVGAKTVGYRFRDELLHIYKVVTPSAGPSYNPVWYRVWGGYVHSAYTQQVDVKLNPVVEAAGESGGLTELTVPYSQPYNYSKSRGWEVNDDFYLYHGSTHWITDIVEGPDLTAWYEITDELWSGFRYYVPATHLREIPPEEVTPLSPDVPFDEKRIEVSLTHQVLTAYEGEEVVFRGKVSTGINRPKAAGALPTRTPEGKHNVQSKLPSKHMGSGRLTDTLNDTALPGVPWAVFFAAGGYALHGTYWHSNFGLPMSRGCVNLNNEDAKWLFRWTTPAWDPYAVAGQTDWEVRGYGTRVKVVG